MAGGFATKTKINVRSLSKFIVTLTFHSRSDHEKFGLESPDFTLCDEIEADLKKQEHIWCIFEEFSNELEALYNEEWIVFRKKIYRLDDFLLHWKEKLQNDTNSPLASRILQEIHKYEVTIFTIFVHSNVSFHAAGGAASPEVHSRGRFHGETLDGSF